MILRKVLEYPPASHKFEVEMRAVFTISSDNTITLITSDNERVDHKLTPVKRSYKRFIIQENINPNAKIDVNNYEIKLIFYISDKCETNVNEEIVKMCEESLKDKEFVQINQLYDECLSYLKLINGSRDSIKEYIDDPLYETVKFTEKESNSAINEDPDYDTVILNGEETNLEFNDSYRKVNNVESKTEFKVENELKSNESLNSLNIEGKSERLRRLSQQLPKIIITNSTSSLSFGQFGSKLPTIKDTEKFTSPRKRNNGPCIRNRTAYGDYPKRLVSKNGSENVALISNVPFEKIRLLNDAFHTLINLRWRWIVLGTMAVHFGLWLVFAGFWYIAALAHYDLGPDPPPRACVTGGKDFVTIFLASVEAQTTIGFGDRAIDEECPESIFLFIMQLILGTGLSGVLTCVVYAKLTRPEKLSRDGVGFSKKAVISVRDGHLCLMMRAWDLNYDHIIGSEFTAHFITTYRTKEGEFLRHYARPLSLQRRELLLWPVTVVHVIDEDSPLFGYSPEHFVDTDYEITLSLKGASASMGTFTQSQTSYRPKEVLWGYRFPPVVKYDARKQKYVIDHKKLNTTDPVDTPYCSANQWYSAQLNQTDLRPSTPSSFSDQISGFHLGKTSSFRSK